MVSANKLTVQNRRFMKSSDVECCLADLNNIKCEGFDRIPKCALYDARVTLLNPLVCSSKKLTLREMSPSNRKYQKLLLFLKREVELKLKIIGQSPTFSVHQKFLRNALSY